jgi:hypothetical protein
MQALDLKPGNSYACKFKTHTFLDETGHPVHATNLQLGQAHPGTPGEYQGIGVVKTRDLDKQLVELVDVETNTVHIVHFDNTWDYDTVEYV